MLKTEAANEKIYYSVFYIFLFIIFVSADSGKYYTKELH